MDENGIALLEDKSPEIVQSVLKRFIEQKSQTFNFEELNHGGKRQRLWTALFNILEDRKLSHCHTDCLACIRILSRDKVDLNELVTEQRVEILLRLAGLVPQEEALTMINQTDADYEVMLEALKCLCNSIYNSEVVQAICSKNHAMEGIVIRMRTYRDPEIPQSIKMFDMKLLFLITGFCAEVRPRLKDEYHGLTYLMESLDLILKEASGGCLHYDEIPGAGFNNSALTLSDDHVTLACEILKILFNLSVKCRERETVDEEEDSHYLRLVSILHDLLLCRTENMDKQDALQSHTVNLLMTLPSISYEELMTPVQKDTHDIPKTLEFEGKNMEAVAVLLGYLDEKLAVGVKSLKSSNESLTAILSVLLEGSRHHRPIRKFLRARILPPLTNVMTRPEEGDTLRNRLCKLLTSPATPIRDLVANFLFVLCKENVSRMVKYTGYGNAAGLLANRGLLVGGNRSHSESRYSSDSEDSDTEEYLKYKDSINPVTGCYEPPHPDPTADMTEEQKEYEAVKLMNLMDKLARDGIVQPCRVGEDGRPEPVEHVLQLVEELPRQQVKQGDLSDSD